MEQTASQSPKESEKTAEQKAQVPAMELDTAIIIMLPADGSSVMVDGSVQVPNATTKRVATWDDAYRMVCDAKSQMEAMRMSSFHVKQIRAMSEQMQHDRTKKMIIQPGGRA
jgi:hypothetical protein